MLHTFYFGKKVEDDIFQNSNEFDNLTSILRIVKINSGAREMDQRIKCVPHNLKDLTTVSRTHVQLAEN